MTFYVDFICKFGGSAVTTKTSFETADFDAIQHAAAVLKQSLDRARRFIVIHGAGSFGHFQAKEYRVRDGYRGTSDGQKLREGFCKTRVSVCTLNQLITKALVDAGIPAVSLPPFGSWFTNNGAVVNDCCDVIEQTLEAGFIPVLHGDAVIDFSKGTSILSGDTIVKVICSKIPLKHVIFLSDIDGVYTKPPQEEGAQLITQVSISTDGKVEYTTGFGSGVAATPAGGDTQAKGGARDPEVTQLSNTCSTVIETSQTACDVTGGIQLKLDSAVDIVKTSQGKTTVTICNIKSKAFENLVLKGLLGSEKATQLVLKSQS